MPRPLNAKCSECSKTNWRIKANRKNRPECYRPSACHKKICYYRDLDHYRDLLRKSHRYLKFLGGKCLVCGSADSLEAHHVHSQASGGLDIPNNIVTLCHACHNVITIYTRRIGIERPLKP